MVPSTSILESFNPRIFLISAPSKHLNFEKLDVKFEETSLFWKFQRHHIFIFKIRQMISDPLDVNFDITLPGTSILIM
jgi:hypothetical protein